jgi:hypothetical protein
MAGPSDTSGSPWTPHEIRVCLKERDNTIIALRKDLNGAQAKLSDMTGELSEEQKIIIEDLHTLSESQSRDLVAANDKLSSLSQIVDTQTKEIESLNGELVWRSSEVTKVMITIRLPPI